MFSDGKDNELFSDSSQENITSIAVTMQPTAQPSPTPTLVPASTPAPILVEDALMFESEQEQALNTDVDSETSAGLDYTELLTSIDTRIADLTTLKVEYYDKQITYDHIVSIELAMLIGLLVGFAFFWKVVV